MLSQIMWYHKRIALKLHKPEHLPTYYVPGTYNKTIILNVKHHSVKYQPGQFK